MISKMWTDSSLAEKIIIMMISVFVVLYVLPFLIGVVVFSIKWLVVTIFILALLIWLLDILI